MQYWIVFVGAGIGGAMRLGVNQAALRLFGPNFPWGTLAVNVVGSLAMGLIAEYFALKGSLPMSARLFLTTGILGGFTTLSAFSLDTATLWERGAAAEAFAYVAATLLLSLGALCLGLFLVRAAFAPVG